MISDLSFLYSRSEEKTKCLFSRYLQTSAAQVPFMEPGLNSYSENSTNLLLLIFAKNFLLQECNRTGKSSPSPPIPPAKLKEWGYFTLHTNSVVKE